MLAVITHSYQYTYFLIFQMGTIIIALTYFAMYVTRFIFVEEVIHRFHSTYLEEFVDVSSVAYWDQVRYHSRQQHHDFSISVCVHIPVVF